jgi:hypothetical protein
MARRNRTIRPVYSISMGSVTHQAMAKKAKAKACLAGDVRKGMG